MKQHWNAAQRRRDVGTGKRFHARGSSVDEEIRRPSSEMKSSPAMVDGTHDFKGYWIEEMHSRYFDVFIVFAGGCSFGGWCANWWHGQVWSCDGVCHGTYQVALRSSRKGIEIKPSGRLPSDLVNPFGSVTVQFRPLSLRAKLGRWWSDVAKFFLGCACTRRRVSPWCRLSLRRCFIIFIFNNNIING